MNTGRRRDAPSLTRLPDASPRVHCTAMKKLLLLVVLAALAAVAVKKVREV